MALFNRKKVTDTPKEKQQAPEQFKEIISNAARDLKNLIFSKKFFEIKYNEESYTIVENTENKSLSAIYFNKDLKTMYKENMRAHISSDKNINITIQSIEILKLGENNEIVGYTNIEKVHHYHPYQEDTFGEIKQSWTKENGYTTSKTETESYMNQGESKIITDIIKNVVTREIANRKTLKTEKSQNR